MVVGSIVGGVMVVVGGVSVVLGGMLMDWEGGVMGYFVDVFFCLEVSLVFVIVILGMFDNVVEGVLLVELVVVVFVVNVFGWVFFEEIVEVVCIFMNVSCLVLLLFEDVCYVG